MEALGMINSWPVDHAAAAVIRPSEGGLVAVGGERSLLFRLASLTKPLASWAIMVAVEDGSLSLDTPIDARTAAFVAERIPGVVLPAGLTLRHLLAHAAGYPFTGPAPIAEIERKRIYSNTGFEVAAAVTEAATEIPFAEYLHLAVFEPLGMSNSALRGSAAHGVWSTVDDMARFVGEMLRPQLLAQSSHAMVCMVQYRGLAGIVPGVGTFDPCPWGLGVEVLGAKSPHWMGTANSPATFGHFGGAGTMMWADPVADIGLVALTDRAFDDWPETAIRSWRTLSDAVLAEASR